jgi:sterol desaturase/sphingolipid hydroxylase (fatty acid hydroxylase superfamily)
MDTLVLVAQQDGAGDLLGGLGALACVFALIGLAVAAFWLWMLIDALLNEPTTNEKILWFLVIFFLPLIGSLIYFFVRRQSRRR